MRKNKNGELAPYPVNTLVVSECVRGVYQTMVKQVKHTAQCLGSQFALMEASHRHVQIIFTTS